MDDVTTRTLGFGSSGRECLRELYGRVAARTTLQMHYKAKNVLSRSFNGKT
jgi:hypothetical protein